MVVEHSRYASRLDRAYAEAGSPLAASSGEPVPGLVSAASTAV
jgi:hypothetical protein